MKIPFEKRLIYVFTIIFIGIIVTGLVSYLGDKASDDTNRRTEHSKEVIYQSEQVLSIAKDIVLNIRAYLITNDSAFSENFIAAKKSIFTHIDSLKNLTEDNSIQQMKIDTLNNWTHINVEFPDNAMKVKDGNRLEAVGKMISSKEGMLYTEEIKRIITETM